VKNHLEENILKRGGGVFTVGLAAAICQQQQRPKEVQITFRFTTTTECMPNILIIVSVLIQGTHIKHKGTGQSLIKSG